MNNNHHHGTPYWAVALIIFGLIFLLGNFGIIPTDFAGKLWPLFIIIPGVLMLLPHKNN